MSSVQESSFGRKLRVARRLKRLTQEALAERAGLTKQTINGLEQGRNQPSIKTLVALDEALGQKVEMVDLEAV